MSETSNNNILTENIAICEHCGMKVKVDAQFCSACGKPVIAKVTKIFCQTCGTELGEDEMFCPKCGSTTSQNKNAEVLNNITAYNTTLELQPKRKSKMKMLAIIVAVLIVCIIGFVVLALPEIKYRQANQYQEDGLYHSAYEMFVELDDYKKSEDEVTATVMLWAADSLGSESTYEVDDFCNTVNLTSEQYSLVYSTIVLYVNNHSDANYWFNYGATETTRNVVSMLNTIPASHENTATYLEIFNALTSCSNYKDLFEKHSATIKKCWSLPFIKNMAKEDDAILYFLKDRWTTWSGDYYLEFYENDSGSISSSYNLPWVAEPRGTKYYDIEDMVYYFDGDNNNHLAKVYRFEIEDYDTLKVFCYKNNRTYTVYR